MIVQELWEGLDKRRDGERPVEGEALRRLVVGQGHGRMAHGGVARGLDGVAGLALAVSPRLGA